MKKILFLLLLSISSTITCQTTNTRLTEKCFPIATVNEMYKGLKQGENLKLVLTKTEETLKESRELNAEQKIMTDRQNEIIVGKESLLTDCRDIAKQEKIVSQSAIDNLKIDLQIQEKTARKTARKKFWQGVKIGGVSVAVLGVAGLILLR